MAVSIRNIEKFFSDHPELFKRKTELLREIEKYREGKLVTAGAVKKVFGAELAYKFFKDFNDIPEHMEIALKDLKTKGN